MEVSFENVLERDMDFLLIRKFTQADKAFWDLFLKKIGSEWSEKYSLIRVAHSVMTTDGETDVEVVYSDGEKKWALLIEDKIDAVAQPEQENRYEIRGKKAVENNQFDGYNIFIVAPKKYLTGNKEAAKYPNSISYEEIRKVLTDEYEVAIIDKALDESKQGYIPIEDKKVTQFWDKLYDFVEERFPDTFSMHGKKGDSRGANARWITIRSGKGTNLQVKADRGYVDLEISGYADKFQEFSKANQDLLDRKKLYVRLASKSLAIRKYIEPIDFGGDFDDQKDAIEEAFIKAKELQDLVKDLKF